MLRLQGTSLREESTWEQTGEDAAWGEGAHREVAPPEGCLWCWVPCIPDSHTTSL